MSIAHKADAAFTKRGNLIEKPSKAVSSAPLEFVSSGVVDPGAQRTSRTADLLNPLFCPACNKVFAKETVFHAHKSGKKHTTALKAMGFFEEADAEVAKASAESAAKASGKRELGAADEDDRKRPACAHERPTISEAAPAVSMPPVQADGVEHEWWKGTVHAKPKQSGADGAAPAPTDGTGDWLCVSQRCTGVKNARNAPNCKACGALRRLGAQSVRPNERDSVNDYTRRQ